MTSTLLKYNVILIVLCIGMTLIHNSSGEKVKKEINLYFDYISPPCRAVLLTLEALNLEFNLKYINLLKKETRNENFLKMNPLHTVPVMEDGDFVLSESHAIIVYLVREYGGEEVQALYPSDPKFRAQVNQRLHFDNGTLYLAFRNHYNPWIYYRTKITPEGEKEVQDALKFLEGVLKTSTWAAGESMTVADFSLVTSISTFMVAGVDLSNYENINSWFKMCKEEMVGYETANQEGVDVTVAMLKSLDEKFAKKANTPNQ